MAIYVLNKTKIDAQPGIRDLIFPGLLGLFFGGNYGNERWEAAFLIFAFYNGGVLLFELAVLCGSMIYTRMVSFRKA